MPSMEGRSMSIQNQHPFESVKENLFYLSQKGAVVYCYCC
jgi:hypothetical protein